MCRTYQATCTEVIVRSWPASTWASALPHGQSRICPAGSYSAPQDRQRQRPAVSLISGRAPCMLVPSVARSKQNRSESGTTPDSAPISSRTQVTLASGSRPVTWSTTPSMIASSCMASADAGQRVADQQVDDPGPAEGRLELHDARRVVGNPADDGRPLAERVRAQGRDRGVGLIAVHDGDETALAGHVHRVDAEQLGGAADLGPDRDVILDGQDADVGRLGDLVEGGGHAAG